MKDLQLKVEATLPTLNTNFEAMKLSLQTMLSKYDIVVDEDGVKFAKQTATQINTLSKEIDEARKSKVKELSAPIKEFEAQAKELVSLCQDSRTKLLEQVKVFEDKQREECLALLNKELLALYGKLEISEEFRTIRIDDLAIISNLTKGGRLAKKAIDTLEDRVYEIKRFQVKIEKRLNSLSSVCLEKGLNAPLERVHINHFLMRDDEEDYNALLDDLIQVELKRQEFSKQKELQKSPIKEEVKTPPATSSQATTTSTDGKGKYRITAVFEVEVNSSLEPKLKEALAKKLAAAGFQSSPTITVERVA